MPQVTGPLSREPSHNPPPSCLLASIVFSFRLETVSSWIPIQYPSLSHPHTACLRAGAQVNRGRQGRGVRPASGVQNSVPESEQGARASPPRAAAPPKRSSRASGSVRDAHGSPCARAVGRRIRAGDAAGGRGSRPSSPPPQRTPSGGVGEHGRAVGAPPRRRARPPPGRRRACRGPARTVAAAAHPAAQTRGCPPQGAGGPPCESSGEGRARAAGSDTAQEAPAHGRRGVPRAGPSRQQVRA